MDELTRRDIRNDLVEMVEPDGYGWHDVAEDLAAEYGVPLAEVEAIWKELTSK